MLDNQELRQRIKQKETERFILRVMVALVILYDHIHPTGAFAKGSLDRHIKRRKNKSLFSNKNNFLYI